MRGRGSPLLSIAALAAAVLFVTAASAWAGATARGREATRRIVLVTPTRSVTAMRYDGHFLTWETSGTEDNPAAAVFERDERTGRVTRLATNVLPDLDLAANARWIVYARLEHKQQQLVAVSRDNRVRRVLARSLVTPIDVRGNRIAWVERVGGRQRVVVQSIDGGARWIASDLPTCSKGRCYRVDAVTLANEGVVFDRAQIGASRSLIIRRRFGASSPSTLVLKDPQPDLRRSATGAFYYYVQRGWFRWDFDSTRPVRVPVRGSSQDIATVQDGRVLIVAGSHCRQSLALRLPNGSVRQLGGPAPPKIVPTYGGSICRQLTAVGSSPGEILVAWSFLPVADLEAHNEADLVGVVTLEKL
jgi:hypothetical protein